MRTYDERIANIRAKAKATKTAYRAIAASLTTLGVLAVMICGLFFWRGLPFAEPQNPSFGPGLQPSGNFNPMEPPTMMAPDSPDDVIGFQVNALKLHSGEDWGLGPVVIRSVEELKLFCDRQAALYNDWPTMLTKPSDSIAEWASKYDDAFFVGQSLILLMKPEGSGGNQLEVADIFWTDGNSVLVIIDRLLPEVGTADMAYWYLLIETDRQLPEGTTVDAMYRINGNTWQEPAYERMEIPVKTREIYYGTPDMDAKYPRVDVITSVDELQAYLAGLHDDFTEEAQQYDTEFFITHTLLVLWNQVGSSSEEYYVNEVWRMSDGGISIRGQKHSPAFCSEDIMSWMIFIEAEADISHYAKIVVEYETVTQAVPPERPEDTDLEFWIGQDVADVDFSSHDEVYGLFGAREYLGKDYQMLYDAAGEQQYPQEYVSYLVGAFPDEADGGSFVTCIEIRDASVQLYGLNILSTGEEFEAVFRSMAYSVEESNGTWTARKNGVTFTFRQGEYLTIRAQVTNREGIIY